MTGGVWIVSYAMLWLTVIVLGLAVLALLRQVGVLHARLRPVGVHFAGEGPERLQPAPMPDHFDYRANRLTLLAFTSPTCVICAQLAPGLTALAEQYRDVKVHQVDHGLGPDAHAVFRAFNVSSTPYFVAVDRGGVVQGRGVANSMEQIEVLIEESLAPQAALG